MSDDDYFFESHLYVKRLNETINFIELKFSEHFNYINTKNGYKNIGNGGKDQSCPEFNQGVPPRDFRLASLASRS